MSKTDLTKRAMADAFKKLMQEYPINKIKVKMITDTSGVTRHTFYNHFHDVYELLGWIYENELIEELDEVSTMESWRKSLSLVLDYTYKNRVICMNTCKSLGREHLELFLHKTFEKIIFEVMDDISRKTGCSSAYKSDIASFFSYAITGEFLQWINGNFAEKKDSLEERIYFLLNGTVSFLLSEHRY